MPTISITNNLSFDVDIYDVYNPTADFQDLLTYSKLGTVASQAKGNIDTTRSVSQLQAMYTGNLSALNNNYYYQFPVADLSNAAADNNAFALTTDMQQGMEQAFQFIKYTQANADSKTAKDFRTSLANTTDQTTAVNTFFANTGSFKQCTLASWMAVLSWQNQFTSAWQGTYYLYSVADDSTTPRTASALVGTLVVTSDDSDNSAIFTMADADGTSTVVVMAGDGSLQEQNAGTGDLLVNLTPVWMSVTQTSQQDGKPSTSYRIGAAFTGTINGVKVAGNLNQVFVPDSGTTGSDGSGSTDSDPNNNNGSNSNPDKWDGLHLSETIISSLAVLVAALAGAGACYVGYKQYNLLKNQIAGESANKESIKKLEDRLKDLEDAKPGLEDKVKTLEDTLPDLYIDQTNAKTNKQSFDELKKEVTDLNDLLLTKAPSDKVEGLVKDMDQVKKDIGKGTIDQTDLSDRLTQLKDQTDDLIKENSTNLQKEVIAQVEKTNKAITELTEQVKSLAEAQEKAAEKAQAEPSEEVSKEEFKDPETKEVDPVTEGKSTL